jgi:hypothetical protein
MWDWTHFKDEGLLAHTKRSVRLASLLLLSGLAMTLHIVVPFWVQPKFLQVREVANALCRAMEECKRE